MLISCNPFTFGTLRNRRQVPVDCAMPPKNGQASMEWKLQKMDRAPEGGRGCPNERISGRADQWTSGSVDAGGGLRGAAFYRRLIRYTQDRRPHVAEFLVELFVPSVQVTDMMDSGFPAGSQRAQNERG